MSCKLLDAGLCACKDYANRRMYVPDCIKLTPWNIEALTWMQDMAEGGDYSVIMDFRPGDMQFINNHIMLHARSAYEDYPEEERKRSGDVRSAHGGGSG